MPSPGKFLWHTFFNRFTNYLMAKSNRPSNSQKSKNKTTGEIVKRHLSDKNDKITEEDFKDLHLDLSVPNDEAHAPLKIEEDKERPKDVEKDNTITTPWDVINE